MKIQVKYDSAVLTTIEVALLHYLFYLIVKFLSNFLELLFLRACQSQGVLHSVPVTCRVFPVTAAETPQNTNLQPLHRTQTI